MTPSSAWFPFIAKDAWLKIPARASRTAFLNPCLSKIDLKVMIYVKFYARIIL